MNNRVDSSHAVTDRTVASTRNLLDWLFSRLGQQNFDVRLWNGETLPAGSGEARFTLVLSHPGALRRMFRPPIELSLGEAFIHGDFDIEGDIHAAVAWIDSLSHIPLSAGDLFALVRQLAKLPGGGESRHTGRGPARLSGEGHSRARDRAAITYHYDVGNEFYALWLDRRMVYSCAYFPTGAEGLDTAQECKLEHICRKLRLQPGERLLDIGCGWGGLVMYAAQKYGVTALGVTLSEKQAAFAAERIAAAGFDGQAMVTLQDYRDLSGETFDKIVSVGMFEHVGRSHLPEYFTHTYHLLKPGGLFLNHGISRRARMPTQGWRAFAERYVLGSGAFVQRYVFPDGELVPVSEACLVAERAGFEVRDVENLREHYALTLHHWVKRLEAHQAEAVDVTDEATYRTWRLYMAGAAHGFEVGNINVNQTLLAKPVGGRSHLPLTRADLYA
ncbi:MAG: class I SAM-dependent methyltransferase [Anaerolineae bacterium]